MAAIVVVATHVVLGRRAVVVVEGGVAATPISIMGLIMRVKVSHFHPTEENIIFGTFPDCFLYPTGDGPEAEEPKNSENPDDNNSTDDDQYRLSVDMKVCSLFTTFKPQFSAVLSGFIIKDLGAFIKKSHTLNNSFFFTFYPKSLYVMAVRLLPI